MEKQDLFLLLALCIAVGATVISIISVSSLSGFQEEYGLAYLFAFIMLILIFND